MSSMRTINMFLILISIALIASGYCTGANPGSCGSQLPQGKPLPPLKEPDWNAFSDVESGRLNKQIEILRFLGEIRPERKYKDDAELKAMKEKVNVAYDDLDSDHTATKAAAIRELRRADDDFYVLSLSSILVSELGEKSIPYITWALTKIKDPDKNFKKIFELAFKLARTHNPEVLPGLFTILKIKDADYFLAEHYWTIPTHQCLLYTIGAYGPGICPYLLPKLSDSDPYVRRNAAFLLGYFSYFAAKPNLIALVKQGGISSTGAAFALGEMQRKDTVGDIAKLLKNPDKDVRYWAAFSLYEMNDKAAIPYLTEALEGEIDKVVKGELEAAINHLKSEKTPSWLKGPKVKQDDLKKILDEAEEDNGLDLEMEEAAKIIASAQAEHIPQLERIREKIMLVLSDKGNKELRLWNEILKTVRRNSHKQTP